MTPTPSPEVIQQAAESAGLFAGLEPAVIAALITGSAAILVALLGGFLSGVIAFLTLNRSNKFERERLKDLIKNERERHEAELAERKADRLFDARKEVASRCLRTIQQYKANKSIDDFEGRRKALRELHATIQEDIGELSLLFSPQVSSIANKIKESSALTVMKLSSFLDIYLKAQLQAEANKTAENSKRLSNVSERYIDFLVDSDKSMQNHFDLFTESLTKELGTYQEPETIEEA